MRKMFTRSLALTLVFAAALPHSLAADDSRYDHDNALAARQSAAILPLAQVLPPVEAAQQGRVIGVELDDEDGLLIYELRLIRDDGTLTEVTVNAATGAVIEVEDADDDDDDDADAPRKGRQPGGGGRP